MKLLKAIINFFKSFFVTAKDFAPKKMKIQKSEPTLSNKEKIYNFLASHGYSMRIHSKDENEREAPINFSTYRHLVMNQKKLYAEASEKGLKIVVAAETNRHGFKEIVQIGRKKLPNHPENIEKRLKAEKIREEEKRSPVLV